MKVERIIATVELGQGRAVDLELPAFLPVSELADKVLEALQALFPAEFDAVGQIGLTAENHELDGSSTLASVGLWDGSVLGIVRR